MPYFLYISIILIDGRKRFLHDIFLYRNDSERKRSTVEDSDSSDEESDNTVYECPGLAPVSFISLFLYYFIVHSSCYFLNVLFQPH